MPCISLQRNMCFAANCYNGLVLYLCSCPRHFTEQPRKAELVSRLTWRPGPCSGRPHKRLGHCKHVQRSFW